MVKELSKLFQQFLRLVTQRNKHTFPLHEKLSIDLKKNKLSPTTFGHHFVQKETKK